MSSELSSKAMQQLLDPLRGDISRRAGRFRFLSALDKLSTLQPDPSVQPLMAECAADKGVGGSIVKRVVRMLQTLVEREAGRGACTLFKEKSVKGLLVFSLGRMTVDPKIRSQILKDNPQVLKLAYSLFEGRSDSSSVAPSDSQLESKKASKSKATPSSEDKGSPLTETSQAATVHTTLSEEQSESETHEVYEWMSVLNLMINWTADAPVCQQLHKMGAIPRLVALHNRAMAENVPPNTPPARLRPFARAKISFSVYPMAVLANMTQPLNASDKICNALTECGALEAAGRALRESVIDELLVQCAKLLAQVGSRLNKDGVAVWAPRVMRAVGEFAWVLALFTHPNEAITTQAKALLCVYPIGLEASQGGGSVSPSLLTAQQQQIFQTRMEGLQAALRARIQAQMKNMPLHQLRIPSASIVPSEPAQSSPTELSTAALIERQLAKTNRLAATSMTSSSPLSAGSSSATSPSAAPFSASLSTTAASTSAVAGISADSQPAFTSLSSASAPASGLSDLPRMCASSGCGKVETVAREFRICGRCKSVCYCGPDCQKRHWKEHKLVCSQV